MKGCLCWKTKRSKNKRKQPDGEPSSPTLLESSRTEEPLQTAPPPQYEELPASIQDEEQEDEFLQKLKEITVNELRMYHVDKLKSKLDICYGSSISNWKSLAYELLGDDPSLQNEIKDLELHYYGGGNPALEFFRRLSTSHPEVSVDDFRQKSKIFHRNDIVDAVDKLLEGRDPKKLKVKDFNMKAKESLASLMNLNIPGVYNWEMFADEYGYKYAEISAIKTTIKEGQSFSPTTKLFELLKKVRPQMRISKIKEKCVYLGRNDVAQLIDDIMREKAT